MPLPFGLTAAAFAWAAALVPLGFLAPVYAGDGPDSLVAVNGPGVLAVLAAPAVVAGLVWFLLHRRCSRGGSATAAWGLIGLLGALSLLGAATIGLFVAPVAALLALAAAHTTPPA